MEREFPQGGNKKYFEITGLGEGGGLYDPFWGERQEATFAAMRVRRVCDENKANMKKVVLGGRAYLILSRYLLHMLHLFKLRIIPPCSFSSHLFF